MIIELYRLTSHRWALKNGNDELIYPTIEDACESMNKLGIGNDQIDSALIELAGTGHTRALFDANMVLHSTDDRRLEGR